MPSLGIVIAKTRTLAVVLALLGTAPLLALAAGLSFHFRHRPHGSIVSSGETRTYRLFVPESYDSTRSTALVISMHGAGGWAGQQRDISRWNRVAEQHGFIVVYPSGLGRVGPRVWRVQQGNGLARDVKFIDDLINSLEHSYNIDPERIYANGLSNGGGMAFVLSCTLADRIAAVGMVAAAQTLPWTWCPEPRPAPMIAFHGTADTIVPYNGGTTWVGPVTFPEVEEWVQGWALRNQCEPAPIESRLADDVVLTEYVKCSARVELYTIEGGGHTWPGGKPLPRWLAGTTTRSIDATELMWEFFDARAGGFDPAPNAHPRAGGS